MKKYTLELCKEVYDYSQAHSIPETAKHFGIKDHAVTYMRYKIRSGTAKPTPKSRKMHVIKAEALDLTPPRSEKIIVVVATAQNLRQVVEQFL